MAYSQWIEKWFYHSRLFEHQTVFVVKKVLVPTVVVVVDVDVDLGVEFGSYDWLADSPEEVDSVELDWLVDLMLGVD